MNGCGAIWVELGPTPDTDRLQQCQRVNCQDHLRQLAWVHADVARWLDYAAQLRRFTVGDRSWVDQGALI